MVVDGASRWPTAGRQLGREILEAHLHSISASSSPFVIISLVAASCTGLKRASIELDRRIVSGGVIDRLREAECCQRGWDDESGYMPLHSIKVV